MNAVERIEAAIQKLEELKDNSTLGEWRRDGLNVEAADGLLIVAKVSGEFVCGGEYDASLIVTLHRTIDAQLAILRAGRTADGVVRNSIDPQKAPGWALEAQALSGPLADAILGDKS